MQMHFISVDFQKNFAIASGACYQDPNGFREGLLTLCCCFFSIEIDLFNIVILL